MKRRWYRFSLRTFLVFQSLIALSAYWWITWPNRTAVEFAQALASQDDLKIKQFCPGRNVLDEYSLKTDSWSLKCAVAAKKRSFLDILLGRGNFVLTVSFEGRTYWGEPYRYSFGVGIDRGHVNLERGGRGYSLGGGLALDRTPRAVNRVLVSESLGDRRFP